MEGFRANGPTLLRIRSRHLWHNVLFAASPLFMGGNLPTSDDLSFQLITHAGMLECNQNGVTGKLVSRIGTIDIWKTSKKGDPSTGMDRSI